MSPRQKTSSRRSLSSQELKSFEWLVIGAGLDPGKFFRKLREDLARTADPIRAANNLHRFLSAGFSSSILHDFQQHPVLQEIALELFSQSQYLADILVRDPELFRWLTTSNALKVTKSRSEFINEALASLQLFTRLEKKLDSLKRFHRREMLRIGARDILKEGSVAAITAELSGLADAVVEAIIELGHSDLGAKTGAYLKNTLCVVGLGKLGGEELNFSSDIDLVFVYDEDGEFDAPHERIRTYHEYYNRLAEFVIRRMTEFTGEGHLYRVDMRLRPEGNAGPLALSRLAYAQYYEIRGALWERQMLLKARPIAGNLETGRRFLAELRPFVFPKTALVSPLDEIREMKERIEQHADQTANIKLGEGGIRDIEFIVQALQLLGAGEDDYLREPNTMLALQRLGEREKIGKPDTATLTAAYQFYRILEHRLQLLHGSQTHSLPETQVETSLLARRLGFSSGQLLLRKINRQRRSVRKVFDAVFREKKAGRAAGQESVRLTRLDRYGFIDIAAAEKALDFLVRELPPFRDTAIRMRALSILKKLGAPDWGLANFSLLADAASLRRTLIQGLNKPEMLEMLLCLSSRSRMAAELLSREPLLFEVLSGQPEEFFSKSRGWEFLLEHDPARFKRYNEFKILLPFLLGESGIDPVTRELSELAEFLLRRDLSSVENSGHLGLVAMGKLGGGEITVRSDLDLLVLYNKDSLDPEAAERAAKEFVRRLGDAGTYEADFRLRPEGKNAPLATEIGYYEEYLSKRASLWERQSLTKGRYLFGDAILGDRFRRLVDTRVYEASLPEQWLNSVREMRGKMEEERSSHRTDLKVGKGGLVDLEFALQMLQLRFGKGSDSMKATNSFEVLRAAATEKILSRPEAAMLKQNLLLMRTLETLLRLNIEKPVFALPEVDSGMQFLAGFLGLKSVRHLKEKVRSLQRQNRRLFERALKIGKR